MADLSALYSKQYRDNIQNDLQQLESKLRNFVDVYTGYKGEGAAPVEFVGAIEMQEQTDRFGDTPMQIPDHVGRWVYPTFWESGIPIARTDLLQTLGDPMNAYNVAARAAFGRMIDNTIIAAADGTAKVGKDGGSSEAFDSANQDVAVATGTSNGLNPDKIAAGIEKLMLADVDVDAEPLVCAISPRQWRDLMGQATVTSSDYVMTKTLLTGKLPNLFGVNFVVSNRVRKVSGTTWQCPLFPRSAVHLGIWADYQAEVFQRPDKRNIWQTYSRGGVGATRTHKRKVVRLLCQ